MTAWLRSLSARMVLLNSALMITVSSLMILTLCLLAENFMQFHLDDTVMDEVRVLEATFALDDTDGVVRIIRQRLIENPEGRQAYLLLDDYGSRLAGNLPSAPKIVTSRDWYAMPTLHQPVDATYRIHRTVLSNGGHLYVAFDDHEITTFITALQDAAAIGLTVSVVIGLVAGIVSSRLTLRQIESVNRTAIRIIAGDLHQRVPLRGSGDEFDRLGATLNEMLDRINELMNSVRYATESIAHDLRSPLARVRNRIESARRETALTPDAQRALFDGLAGEVDHVLTVFASLLRLATIESGVLRNRFHDVELKPLIEDAVDLYEAVASERQIAVSLVVAPEAAQDVRVSGDRDLLFQSVCNLLDNAVKFSPEGSAVTVELSVEADQVRIGIRDQGPGIPADQRDRVFARLVRLDSSRGSPGFGLGLSLVRGIARLHHGECRMLDGAPGTLALLELPRLA